MEYPKAVEELVQKGQNLIKHFEELSQKEKSDMTVKQIKELFVKLGGYPEENLIVGDFYLCVTNKDEKLIKAAYLGVDKNDDRNEFLIEVDLLTPFVPVISVKEFEKQYGVKYE